MAELNYNERSWGIDLISEITVYLVGKKTNISRASGEYTIKSNSTRLFPDVLLHGHSGLLMGWELKMPDTKITNNELIENARKKADLLNLDSFLLWNAVNAVLYVKRDSAFEIIKTWDTSYGGIIKDRISVEINKELWLKSLHEILKDIDSFITNKAVIQKPLIESFSSSQIIDVILKHNDIDSNSIRQACIRNARLNAEVNIWWQEAQLEYCNSDKFQILAKLAVVGWINKIIFAHILTPFRNEAMAVYGLDYQTTLSQANSVFQNISNTCDFYNIFRPALASNYISDDTWSEILELNSLLQNLEIVNIGQDFLQDLLQNSIYKANRKLAGQYATPTFLARLLASLTIMDKTSSVYDPCCGTGTIIRSAYDLKVNIGISPQEAIRTTLASDKSAFPLQMATLSITEPNNIGELLQIFQKDIFDLNVNDIIHLVNPNDGSSIDFVFPAVKNIISNLPFVRSESIDILNPNAYSINNFLTETISRKFKLSNKSDLSAFIVFKLWQLLDTQGRLGIIMSNSWLATDWGNSFKHALIKFYKIEHIVISVGGRWFDNADIITTILILEKRDDVGGGISEDEEINFISITHDFKKDDNTDSIDNIVDAILTQQSIGGIKIQTYNTLEIYRNTIGWNAYFSDLSWLPIIENQLIFARQILDISRGERRGWNDMFYPKNHNIEEIFIRPALRSSRNIDTLVAAPNAEAFCCDMSPVELRQGGFNGAIDWINRFTHERNEKGRPLPEVLSRPNMAWYSMSDYYLADFVTSINCDKRLFIAKMAEPAIVDQRLIRFSNTNYWDKDVIHALLNSIVGLFFLEANGFGRGLGALDLSSSRIHDCFKILNPLSLTTEQQTIIKEKFEPLTNERIIDLHSELEKDIRIEFDRAILNIYGIEHLYENIKNSLLFLYDMRTKV